MKGLGEEIKVAARVHTLGGLSAHADQKGLVDWCRRFRGAPTVALVHGEPEARDTLARTLQSALGRSVVTPQLGERLNIGP